MDSIGGGGLCRAGLDLEQGLNGDKRAEGGGQDRKHMLPPHQTARCCPSSLPLSRALAHRGTQQVRL